MFLYVCYNKGEKQIDMFLVTQELKKMEGNLWD
jgi:uncharacterized protein with ATP-grasp and redox domains